MRHFARAVVIALIAGLPVVAPVAASTASAPAVTSPTGNAVAPLSTAKVVIIVGPTGSQTSSFRSTADAAYAEAIKWSSNVVQLYSPNATWAAVKPALQGASIVVYLGHGNGWPSPYTYDPSYTTKDGLGLNATANNGDNNHKYYGEPYLANEVTLAPNAVVLLQRLCYASGNSEPGYPDPTLSVAMQRVDNYGQGFIKAGARAVIAEGHGSITGMIRDLFSTHQTVLDLWRNQWDANGNDFSFPSMRSPAYTAFMDPDSPSGGYYRSLIGNPGLRTEDVTGVPYLPTDTNPDALVAPGAAEVGVGGATLAPTSSLSGSTATLPGGTIVRVDQTSTTNASAKVRTIDGSTTGWTSVESLVPRDSTAPGVWGLTSGPSRVVPGQTAFALTALLSETSTWRVTVAGVSGTVAQATATSTNASITWDGRTGGVPVASGSYAWTLEASDALGNSLTPVTGSFRVWDGAGTRYTPVTPTRVLDSRFGTGLMGAFPNGTPRTFQVTGLAGIPDDAVAVTGNLTIVGQTSGGYVSLTPTPTANATTSAINAPRGDVRANGVTVPLGATGSLSAVFRGSSGSVAHLIFDVTGYFAPSTSGTTYVPVDPSRLLDTRFGNGLSGAFVNATARTLVVAGNAGVPGNALAITGNVTVTNQTSGGWITITPTADDNPPTSTLNFPGGDTRANNFTLPLGPDGNISAVFRGSAGATADLIIDVTGYFLEGSAGAEYVPIDPVRALDTRFSTGLSGAFVANGSRSFAVSAMSGLPSTAVGVTGNVTIVGPSSSGWVTVAPLPNDNPSTSTINFPAGDTRANGVDMRLESGGLSAVFRPNAGATVHLIFDVTGYFVPSR
ncbi:MAG: hypothetical protein V4515_08135 [Chloroflexota bacterium]